MIERIISIDKTAGTVSSGFQVLFTTKSGQYYTRVTNHLQYDLFNKCLSEKKPMAFEHYPVKENYRDSHTVCVWLDNVTSHQILDIFGTPTTILDEIYEIIKKDSLNPSDTIKPGYPIGGYPPWWYYKKLDD